jgi:hypothetical protein
MLNKLQVENSLILKETINILYIIIKIKVSKKPDKNPSKVLFGLIYLNVLKLPIFFPPKYENMSIWEENSIDMNKISIKKY